MEPNPIQSAGMSNLPAAHAALVLALRSPGLVMKRHLLKLVGADFGFYSGDQLVLFAHKKGFKAKESITIFLDQARTQPVIQIDARQIIDFSAAYDVVDLSTGQKIGMLKRQGWASLAQDKWSVCDPLDREIGILQEDNLLLALVRRFLTNLVPQNYDLLVGGQRFVDYKQNFNPLTYHLKIDFLKPEHEFDRRLAVAAAVLLGSIEGRQK
jgi:hypothetical protein